MQKTITRTLKFILPVLLIASINVFAQNAPGRKIRLDDAIKVIQSRFKTQFAYEHGLLDNKFTTEKALNGSNVEDILKNVLYPNNLLFLYVSDNSYSIVAKTGRFFTGVAAEKSAQPVANEEKSNQTTRRGTVRNELGEPMAFVSVWVKGTNQATQTNDLGGYLLPAVKNTDTIQFSFVGYKKQDVFAGDEYKIDVKMQSINNVLNEVSILSNGYQQISKERETGSASVISGKQLEKFTSDNLFNRLEGQVPGVQINLLSGDAGFFYQSGSSIANTEIGLNSGTSTVGKNNYNITIRGQSTLQGETMPLVVLDGAITQLDINTINPNDIEKITFLKDAAAASIWGVRAANGVIVIDTKKGKRQQAPEVNFSAILTSAEKPDLYYYKTMNAAQQLSYEKELVDRGFINVLPGDNYYDASNIVSPGTYLAAELMAGTITQQQYDAQVKSLSAIDNRSQASKYLLQGAQSQQYNLSVGGGNDYSTYYYSLSYAGERPDEVRNNGKRITTTFNNSWTLFKWATLSTSFKGSFFNLTNDGLNLSTIYSPSSTTLLPYELLADKNGNSINYDRLNPAYVNSLPAGYANWQYNYLQELANNDNTEKDNNYVFDINLKVPLYKGLSVDGFYSNEHSYGNNRTYYDQNTFLIRNLLNYYTYPGNTTNSLGITQGGALSTINTNQFNYSARGQLDYDYTFGKSQVTALAGTEIRETNIGQNTVTLWGYNPSTGYTDNNINFSYTPTYSYIAGNSPGDLTSFNGGGYPTQADKENRFISYFGNAAYTYNARYVVSGSVRYDDYNNFGLDRKYRATPLWSSGFKWNVSREDFMKNVKWVDNLALRATYGVNGNISLSTYPFTYIVLGTPDYVTGQTSGSIIAPANPALRWEKTYVKNVGIDFSLFNNRLNGTLDAYYKNSTDLLYAFPISSVYVGSTSPTLTRNAASLVNKGVDLGLNGTVLHIADWSWNAGLTFSYNTNKITDSRFDADIYSSYFGNYPAGISYVVGYPTDKLFVYRFAGLDKNGLTQIYDHNHQIVNADQSDLSSITDLKYAGRITAPFYGGFNTTLNYKQFSLFAQLTYQFGSVFLRPTIQSYQTNPYGQLTYELSADIANRWEKPGDEAHTDVPGLNGTGTEVYYSQVRYEYSDINVLSADYVRLRQLTFSYRFTADWLSKYGIKGGSLGVSANNLGLLWTANKQGYDPDFTGYIGRVQGLPAARSFSLNANFNF